MKVELTTNQRVAVGRRARRQRGADIAGGAGVVLDVESLAEVLAELLGDQAGEQVARAARPERHDDAHRPAGIGLGGSDAGRDLRLARAGASEDRHSGQTAEPCAHRTSSRAMTLLLGRIIGASPDCFRKKTGTAPIRVGGPSGKVRAR